MRAVTHALDGTPHYSENPDDPVYFFGGYLSSFQGGTVWLPPPIEIGTYEVLPYRSVEHWFQANKARTIEEHEKVRRSSTAWEAKDAGRAIKMIAEEVANWDNVRAYETMLRGHRAKFQQHPVLARRLLATEWRPIAEDSPTDDIWGIRSGQTMKGKNLLGKVLMEVREELREDLKRSPRIR